MVLREQRERGKEKATRRASHTRTAHSRTHTHHTELWRWQSRDGGRHEIPRQAHKQARETRDQRGRGRAQQRDEGTTKKHRSTTRGAPSKARQEPAIALPSEFPPANKRANKSESRRLVAFGGPLRESDGDRAKTTRDTGVLSLRACYSQSWFRSYRHMSCRLTMALHQR